MDKHQDEDEGWYQRWAAACACGWSTESVYSSRRAARLSYGRHITSCQRIVLVRIDPAGEFL